MNDLEYKSYKIDNSISSVVESIWMLKNHSDKVVDGIIIPDGKIDFYLYQSANESFQISITGIGTEPVYKPPFPYSTMFAISFHPLAAEYVFKTSFAGFVNKQVFLDDGFWGFTSSDINNMDDFIQKSTRKIKSLLADSGVIEKKKQKLFELIFSSNGAMSVKNMSEQVSWPSRQINRYFIEQYGVALKSYCSIVRFHSSLKQLKTGELFPKQNYADQPHFIKEVKKFSGVTPKILSKNQNDRFIQLSVMPTG